MYYTYLTTTGKYFDFVNYRSCIAINGCDHIPSILHHSMLFTGCFRIQKMNDVEEIVFSISTTGVNSAVCQVKCSHAKYFAVNSDVRIATCIYILVDIIIIFYNSVILIHMNTTHTIYIYTCMYLFLFEDEK